MWYSFTTLRVKYENGGCLFTIECYNSRKLSDNLLFFLSALYCIIMQSKSIMSGNNEYRKLTVKDVKIVFRF